MHAHHTARDGGPESRHGQEDCDCGYLQRWTDAGCRQRAIGVDRFGMPCLCCRSVRQRSRLIIAWLANRMIDVGNGGNKHCTIPCYFVITEDHLKKKNIRNIILQDILKAV